MSFVQNHPTKIDPKRLQVYVSPGDRCDGCDKQCELGYVYVSQGRYIYPTIAGEIIANFRTERNIRIFASDDVKKNRTPQQTFQQELRIKSFAGKIARYCDHYKTRQDTIKRKNNMSKHTISQVYDIAKTIINDKTIKGSKSHNSYSTNYIFKKDDLSLKIYAPHGGREWDGDCDKWDYNTGYIHITDEHGTLFAETKYNVGRAMRRSRLNPISIFTRLRAPLFFHLIDLAEKRDLDQKETIEYKIATLRMKTR